MARSPGSRCRRWAWLPPIGLLLYVVGALVAHLRFGSRQLIGWAVSFTAAVAALAVNP